jgi:hypothetical protein
MSKETLLRDTIFASALKLLTLYSSQYPESTLKNEVRSIKNNLWWASDPEIAIIQQIDEIYPGDSFEDLIVSYAFCIENFHEGYNWGKVNKAIIGRWGSLQLDHIKMQAWKEIDKKAMKE